MASGAYLDGPLYQHDDLLLDADELSGQSEQLFPDVMDLPENTHIHTMPCHCP